MNHSHVLYDNDPHFKIDPISRNIIDESRKKVRLIQHDHNSERFTFEIPRTIEGHDMASCNLVEVHYATQESNTKIVRGGVYTVDDLQVKADDENVVVCSWLIPNNVTQYVGQLQFLIRFACVNESTGKLEYVWNTGVYTGITIASGIYNSEAQSDNQVPPYNFVTTVDGRVLKFSVNTTEEFEGLAQNGNVLSDCLYIFTDDPTLDEIDKAFSDIIDGATIVGKATHAEEADSVNGIKLKYDNTLKYSVVEKAVIAVETLTADGDKRVKLTGLSKEVVAEFDNKIVKVMGIDQRVRSGGNGTYLYFDVAALDPNISIYAMAMGEEVEFESFALARYEYAEKAQCDADGNEIPKTYRKIGDSLVQFDFLDNMPTFANAITLDLGGFNGAIAGIGLEVSVQFGLEYYGGSVYLFPIRLDGGYANIRGVLCLHGQKEPIKVISTMFVNGTFDTETGMLNLYFYGEGGEFDRSAVFARYCVVHLS